jgi:uncharacterized protein YbaR (Trm112 family)
MRRAFGYDLLACPNCGGKMRLLACDGTQRHPQVTLQEK